MSDYLIISSATYCPIKKKTTGKEYCNIAEKDSTKYKILIRTKKFEKVRKSLLGVKSNCIVVKSVKSL